MKFYKSQNRQNAFHSLPTVEWDPSRERALYEFSRGASGMLEFETDDPELIEKLKAMGYGYDEQQEDAAAKAAAQAVHVGVPKAVPIPPDRPPKTK